MEQIIREILRRGYGIDPVSVVGIDGGWSANAYLVSDDCDRRYIVKQYDKARKSTPKLTSRIDDYMPVVGWLGRNTGLAGKIPYPLKTLSGGYKSEDDSYIYLVSEYIEGKDLRIKTITGNLVLLLADITAELHRYGVSIPVPTGNIKEDFGIEFVEPLMNILNSGPQIREDLGRVLIPFSGEITSGLERLIGLSEGLKNKSLEYVLCHTDIQEGNLIEGPRGLSLIDWENMKLAPREGDLCRLADRKWFRDFLLLYDPRYVPDQEALHFYTLRRLLEDIWEFAEQLQYDIMEPNQRVESLENLRAECEKLTLLR